MSDEVLYVEDEDGDPMVWTDTPDVAPNPNRTVEGFLQSMSPFSAAGPFQIFGSGRDKDFSREEEPRVSLIYEEWNE